MRKTGQIANQGRHEITFDTITCEVAGHTPDGRAIWKDVEDAYECFTYRDGLFWEHEVESWDEMNDLYGTYVDDDGKRVEYELGR